MISKFDQVINQVINLIYCSEPWTGASDTAQESDFRWLNGDPLRYEKFKSGEPREANAQNCIRVTTNGRWQDGMCNVHPQYLCSSIGWYFFGSNKNQGCARFEFLQNFSEYQILWSLCSVVFHALTVNARFCGVCAR